MHAASNHIQNNVLASLTQNASGHVVNAIQTASTKTGVDFAYLVQQAKAESSFNPQAKAKTSSASGLYQFIESTWLNMVEKHGAKHGINPDQSRENLLKLRNDPQKAALLAAEFANENKRYLHQHVGGDIGSTELYFAHFLGAGGASGFLNALRDSPSAIAATLFPKEAAANQNVFYDAQTGQSRTLKQVYDFFDQKFNVGATSEQPHIETPQTLAHKPARERGYQHIPPSLQQEINIRPRGASALIAALLGNENRGLQDAGFYTQPALTSPLSLHQNISPSLWLKLRTQSL